MGPWYMYLWSSILDPDAYIYDGGTLRGTEEKKEKKKDFYISSIRLGCWVFLANLHILHILHILHDPLSYSLIKKWLNIKEEIYQSSELFESFDWLSLPAKVADMNIWKEPMVFQSSDIKECYLKGLFIDYVIMTPLPLVNTRHFLPLPNCSFTCLTPFLY